MINEKNRNKIFIKYKTFIIFLIISFNNLNNSPTIFNNLSDFNNLEKYFLLCNSTKLINKEKNKKINNPKVSIISAVFNRENYLLRFIRSIQNQNFKDIELIFVDDCSKDNSVKIIEKNKKKDERIILIKHKKNKGTFISRNVGVLNSKGKYIIIPDPDDILSRNIINFCYNFLETFNYEMLRFNLYMGNRNIFFYDLVKYLKSKPIYQPELSTYIFYGKGTLTQIDFNISNKFIKREAYIRALNSINKFYLNIYMTFSEDGLMNFILHRSVKSLYFIEKIGYYYLVNKQSICYSNTKSIKLLLKFNFFYLKVIFEYSKNNKYEKDMLNYFFYNSFKEENFTNYKEYFINDYNF